MRVLLVRPPRIKQSIALGEFMYCEPIGLEMVFAMLEKEHQVEILDFMAENIKIEEKLSKYKPHIVGITSLCIDVEAVRLLTMRIKAFDKEILTFVGGTQAFLNSETFFVETVDHVFKYTTNENMRELFKFLSNHENPPLINGICSRINAFKTTDRNCINEYISPNRESTAKYRKEYSYFGYKPCAIMGTAQGCEKHCSFCLRWRIEGGFINYFSLEGVEAEIKSIKEESIMIFDNDFLHNGERLMNICDFLEKEKIKKNFICYGSVNSILKNKQAIKRFHEIGLQAVIVGYETFKDEELNIYNKKSNVDDNLKASLFMREIKLDVWASFIIHPDWDKSDFKQFRSYLKLLRPQVASTSPLTPFPNLPLYEEYKDRLIIRKEDYEAWSFGQVSIEPSRMILQNYYYEILKTNLYINLVINNIVYMVHKFGIRRVLRLGQGSVNLLFKYIRLMVKAG